MTQKLPETNGMMQMSQAILLEVLHMLVEEKIVSEEAAVKQYNSALSKNGSWK